MKKTFLLIFFITIVSCTTKLFAIILPPIMSSNMVLQQNLKATLWGWADPRERFTITCSWKNTHNTVTAFNSGKWRRKQFEEDKNFLPAEVKLEKDKIVVWYKQIPSPVAVRFSFTNIGMSNVFNKEGLPVVAF